MKYYVQFSATLTVQERYMQPGEGPEEVQWDSYVTGAHDTQLGAEGNGFG